MKKSDQKFIAVWEKNLEKGKRNFILKHGIVWGVYMCIVTEIINYFIKTHENPITSGKYIFLFIFWLLAGIINAYVIWYFQNRKFNKLKNSVIS
jgi:hypothetical protein